MALRVTVSSSARLSPRWGTRIGDPRPRGERQPLLVQPEVVRLGGDEHLLGHAERRLVAVEVVEHAVDQPGRGQVLDLVEHEALAADHPALAHVEHLDRRLELVVGDADHVEVLVAVGHHLLALDGLAHRRQPVAQARRPLELEVVGGLAHVGVELLHDGVGVAVEELAQLVDEPS